MNGLAILLFLSAILGPGVITPALASAAENEALAEVLARTGKSVESFWHQVSSYVCAESVTREKLGVKGKVEYREVSVSDYLLLTKMEADGPRVEESREPRERGQARAEAPPLLATDGFPTLLLVFHPYYRNDYRYSIVGSEASGEQKLLLLRFEHIPGRPSTTALALRGRIIPLDLQGTAWVDPETGTVHRIEAQLAAPVDSLNLREIRVLVTYAPQRFSAAPDVKWLPVSATVDLMTLRQHWRNVHRFENYRQFTVQSKGTVSK